MSYSRKKKMEIKNSFSELINDIENIEKKRKLYNLIEDCASNENAFIDIFNDCVDNRYDMDEIYSHFLIYYLAKNKGQVHILPEDPFFNDLRDSTHRKQDDKEEDKEEFSEDASSFLETEQKNNEEVEVLEEKKKSLDRSPSLEDLKEEKELEAKVPSIEEKLYSDTIMEDITNSLNSDSFDEKKEESEEIEKAKEEVEIKVPSSEEKLYSDTIEGIINLLNQPNFPNNTTTESILNILNTKPNKENPSSKERLEYVAKIANQRLNTFVLHRHPDRQRLYEKLNRVYKYGPLGATISEFFENEDLEGLTGFLRPARNSDNEEKGEEKFEGEFEVKGESNINPSDLNHDILDSMIRLLEKVKDSKDDNTRTKMMRLIVTSDSRLSVKDKIRLIGQEVGIRLDKFMPFRSSGREYLYHRLDEMREEYLSKQNKLGDPNVDDYTFLRKDTVENRLNTERHAVGRVNFQELLFYYHSQYTNEKEQIKMPSTISEGVGVSARAKNLLTKINNVLQTFVRNDEYSAARLFINKVAELKTNDIDLDLDYKEVMCKVIKEQASQLSNQPNRNQVKEYLSILKYFIEAEGEAIENIESGSENLDLELLSAVDQILDKIEGYLNKHYYDVELCDSLLEVYALMACKNSIASEPKATDYYCRGVEFFSDKEDFVDRIKALTDAAKKYRIEPESVSSADYTFLNTSVDSLNSEKDSTSYCPGFFSSPFKSAKDQGVRQIYVHMRDVAVENENAYFSVESIKNSMRLLSKHLSPVERNQLNDSLSANSKARTLSN
ncbi:MAG: hypothetical protein ACE365_04685 [Gammaproteobacteria bacterium]